MSDPEHVEPDWEKLFEPIEQQDSSPVLAAALAMHEMYVTLQQAGFTPQEALTIVIEVVGKGR